MTRPVHTVKYMQANYRKYQLLAVACALLTITASVLAALSGIRINTLRNASTNAAAGTSAAQAAVAASELAHAQNALAQARDQLDAERGRLAVLKSRIEELERRLDVSENSSDSPAATVPSSLQPESEAVHTLPPAASVDQTVTTSASQPAQPSPPAAQGQSPQNAVGPVQPRGGDMPGSTSSKPAIVEETISPSGN